MSSVSGNSVSKKKATNQPSQLLSPEENDALFTLLGYGCVTLSTGVVQLYLSSPPDHETWDKFCCGVVCFVKDNLKRSYFMRVYDIVKLELIWEQELYLQLVYKTFQPFFHTFETDEGHAGFNFASDNEADLFKKVVQSRQKLPSRTVRKIQSSEEQLRSPVNEPLTNLATLSQRPANQPSTNGGLYQRIKNVVKKDAGKKGKKNLKRKVSKIDIGSPTSFMHVQHGGFDTKSSVVAVDDLNPTMKKLFGMFGANSTKDKEFIMQFIENHGGMDAVQKDFNRQNDLKKDSTTPSTGSPTSGSPTKIQGHSRSGRSAPASPPIPPPPQPQLPPPPPPPPPPPLPMFSMEGAGKGGEPSVMLEPAQNGTTLKKVMPGDGPPEMDSRSQLLQQICSGTRNLRKVEKPEENEQPSQVEIDGILGALARALADRHKHIQDSDVDSEDNLDDDLDEDDEWDD